jgi:hypothetical protein
MINKLPDSTDLYSEFGAVSRCARLDFDAIQDNLKKMEHVSLYFLHKRTNQRIIGLQSLFRLCSQNLTKREQSVNEK